MITERDSAPGTFSLPEAPASSMSSIAEHIKISRETLAEEYGLLHLPPLAVTPGRPHSLAASLQHPKLTLRLPESGVRTTLRHVETPAFLGMPMSVPCLALGAQGSCAPAA